MKTYVIIKNIKTTYFLKLNNNFVPQKHIYITNRFFIK